jgi:UDP-hydrolysing UDP-N-acetyl-D-glucosamine 2-epimerase
MNSKRRVAVFTGNRAEYGLLMPILRAIHRHPELECELLVSGAHLDEDFGQTRQEIEKDGFNIAAEVKLTMGQDDLLATAQAIGSGVCNLSKTLAELKPDLLVVYADRFEGFAAMITGTQMNIPTAHVEGGDITEGGALDDSVRHAMSKLAHLHFTTNQDAADRIARLGEEPWRIHNVGFPAIDLIAEGQYATPEELAEQYGLTPDRPIALFTQHSITTEFRDAAAQIHPALDAMKQLADEDWQVILTYPNNDAGGRAIIRELEAVNEAGHPNIQVHSSLGRHNYHGILNMIGRLGSGACVGNSSSGIKETPALACPTVNVGSRQQGRLRADNVLDVPYDTEAILAACRRTIEDHDFRHICRTCANPYGVGDAGTKIADALAAVELSLRLLQKKMTY